MKIMGNSKITPMTPLDGCSKGSKPSAAPAEKGPYSGPNAAPLNGNVAGSKKK